MMDHRRCEATAPVRLGRRRGQATGYPWKGQPDLSATHPKVISVFGSATIEPNGPEYARAQRLGQLLAEAGWVVLTGGFGGAMAAACRGARMAGGHTVGATLAIWNQPANPWVCEERPQDTYLERLVHVATVADGYVAVDGGIGTLGELALVWSLLETRSLPLRPLVALGERWRRLFDLFAGELIVRREHLELVSVVATPEEAVQMLRRGLG